MVIRLLFILSILQASCSTKLRVPFCPPGELTIPDRMVGIYYITMPVDDPQLSGARNFEDIFIRFTKPQQLFIEANAYSRIKNDRKWHRLWKLNTKPLESRSLAGAICTLDGKTYYSQTINSDHTFGLAKIELADDYFSLDQLIFNRDVLTESGISYTYFPSVTEFRDDKWQTDPIVPVQLIVDNRDIDRQSLLQAARTVFGGLKFTKVNEAKNKGLREKSWIQIF